MNPLKLFGSTLKPTQLPNVEHADARVFFEGWWNGIAIGFICGAGLTVFFAWGWK